MYKLLIVLICIGNSKSQYFFVVKKFIGNRSAGHYYCITNSSSGLSWINEDNTNNIIPQQVSNFISDSRNDFEWNLEAFSTPKPWWSENSLEGKINEVILDRRWETLKVTQTEELGKNFSNPTNLTFLVKNKEGDFAVPFSIRANAADIIFLLDVNTDDFSPMLYWLNLHIGAEFKTMYQLRACSGLYLAEAFCASLETNLQLKLLPSDEEWFHFKITRRENLLTLLQTNGSNHMEIVQYNDTSIRSIVIGGLQQQPILWKIHELKYMFTTNITENIRFGPAINLGNHSICISMFISMCQTCSLKVTLQNDDENRSDMPRHEKTYNYETTGWVEIKFIVEHIKNQRVLLLLSTLKTSSGEGFWAVDQIRQCRERNGKTHNFSELRMLASSEKAKCQLISGGNAISIEEELRGDKLFPSEQFSKNNCPENTIGSICMPCTWIFSETCGRLSICENYMGGNKCYNSECKCVAQFTTPSPPPKLSQINLILVVIVATIFLIIVICTAIFRLHRYKRFRSRSGNNEITIPLTHLSSRRNDDDEDAIDLTVFINYVRDSIKNDSLKEEYMMIFKNAIAAPYEEIYESLCFIDMYFTNDIIKKAYVVTKVPERDKIDHFWKTIWDQNVEYIVLIDDIYSRRTSGNYWAEKNENLQCDNISIQLYLSEFFADYEYRKFIMVDQEQNIKYVDQLRLISWSDNKPQHFLNLVPFFQIMSDIPFKASSPILVHCRNGTEGTGFALLCDMCLRIARKGNTINVPKVCQKLCDCSTKLMIKTVERYIMAHLVIVETLSYIETSVKCDSFDRTKKTSIDQKVLEDQKCFLTKVQWRDEIIETMKPKRNSNYYRVSISPVTSRMSVTLPNPLKVTVVDGFRYPGKFTVTQTPGLKNTSNFWRLIAEKNITAIVSLNEISAQDFDFRPSDKQPLIKPSRSVSVKYEQRYNLDFLDWVVVQLRKSNGEALENQNVDIISIKHWPSATICPPDTYNFVKFCAESERVAGKSSSVMVTCSDGITASGLYVAMMYNIEKMKQEQVCDVCTSVRNVRFYCPQFVKHQEQFGFLWEAATTYMKEFRLYDNFS